MFSQNLITWDSISNASHGFSMRLCLSHIYIYIFGFINRYRWCKQTHKAFNLNIVHLAADLLFTACVQTESDTHPYRISRQGSTISPACSEASLCSSFFETAVKTKVKNPHSLSLSLFASSFLVNNQIFRGFFDLLNIPGIRSPEGTILSLLSGMDKWFRRCQRALGTVRKDLEHGVRCSLRQAA